ncbi:MAG TPA: hypothetical protein VKO63_00940, partial [Chitinispirillaceae bacterium]|nr:hypothetical protein [Chitinispirillaceae bacterium]
MNKVVYTIIIAVLSLLVYGCGGESLSGTEVGNPAIIAGKVQDSDQQGLGGASVYLVTPDYNAALDSTHLEKSKDTNTLIGEIMSEDEEQCV